MTKFILVSGGVVSGIGKGVIGTDTNSSRTFYPDLIDANPQPLPLDFF